MPHHVLRRSHRRIPRRGESAELALPEAGVCGGAGAFDADDEQAEGCCAAPAEPEPATAPN